MISKIELLQQVLDLEPASRLFFPLAELLYAEGDLAAAERVLRQGVIHHPDHLEAKFFLVQICTRLGREDEARALYAPLSELLGRYSAVLELWAGDHAPRAADFPAALAALDAHLKGRGLDWAGLLLAGFEASGLSGDDAARPAPGASVSVPVEAPRPSAPPESPAKPATAEAARSKPAPRGGPAPMSGAAEVAALAKSLAEEPARPAARVGKASGPSVVTKTMAALLVGQGDYKGALAIYEELFDQAADPENRETLAKLITETRAKLGECVPAEAPRAQDAVGGKKKFLGMLETLAGRLEARG